MPVDPNLSQRTDSKLSYARLHLDELRGYQKLGSGDNYERAHEESVLYHLVGTKDAFLQEINYAYGLGLGFGQVDEQRLTKELKRLAQPKAKALVELEQLTKGSNSWYSLMIALRNHGSHRYHIHRLMKVGVGSARDMPRTTHFKDPRNGKDIAVDSLALLEQFCGQLEDVIGKLRTSLP